jgi:hypothetical protein
LAVGENKNTCRVKYFTRVLYWVFFIKACFVTSFPNRPAYSVVHRTKGENIWQLSPKAPSFYETGGVGPLLIVYILIKRQNKVYVQQQKGKKKPG